MKIANVIDNLIQYERGKIDVKEFEGLEITEKLTKLGHDTDRDKIFMGKST